MVLVIDIPHGQRHQYVSPPPELGTDILQSPFQMTPELETLDLACAGPEAASQLPGPAPRALECELSQIYVSLGQSYCVKRSDEAKFHVPPGGRQAARSAASPATGWHGVSSIYLSRLTVSPNTFVESLRSRRSLRFDEGLRRNQRVQR